MSGANRPDPRAARRSLLLRLRLLQLGLWLERLVASGTRGLCVGLAMALGGAIALVAQAGVLDRVNLVLAALAGLVLGVLWGLVRPPSLAGTARVADARFGLDARTGTAVELLKRPSGRLVEAQLLDAARSLRSARRGWPFPLTVAWREAVAAGVLALGLVGLLGLEGRGSSLLVGLPTSPPDEAALAGEREALAPSVPAAAAPGGEQPATKPSTGVLRTLDELRRARESGQLTPEQAEAMLNQVEGELSQRAAEARGQRQTLDRLARALSQVSAAEQAAESIQEGDLAEAGEELSQLGREADQLSQEAKNQLAQALRRAAAESGSNPALAERERRAAEALAGRDYQAQQAALAALGNEVAKAGGQGGQQDELAAASERLQAEREAMAGQGAQAGQAGQPGGQRAAAAAAAQRQQGGQERGGQAGGSQAGQGEGSGRGSGGGQGDGAGDGQAAKPQAPEGPAERSDPLALDGPAARLDVAGKQVDVPARPGANDGQGRRTERAGENEETVERADTAFDSPLLSAPVRAGGQSERIVVPGEQRQVVREYFGRRAARN